MKGMTNLLQQLVSALLSSFLVGLFRIEPDAFPEAGLIFIQP